MLVELGQVVCPQCSGLAPLTDTPQPNRFRKSCAAVPRRPNSGAAGPLVDHRTPVQCLCFEPRTLEQILKEMGLSQHVAVGLAGRPGASEERRDAWRRRRSCCVAGWNAEESLRRASSGCQRRMAGHLWSRQSGGEGRRAKQRVEVPLTATDFEQSKARVERAKRHAGLPRHEKCWQLPIQKVAAHDFSTWLAQKNIQKNKGRATKTFNSNILAAQEKHQGFFTGNAWVGPRRHLTLPRLCEALRLKDPPPRCGANRSRLWIYVTCYVFIIYNHIWKKHIIISIYIKPVACPSKDLWNYLKWLNILNKIGYIMIDKQCMALIYPSYSRYQHGNNDPKLETSKMTIQKQDLPIFRNHRLGLTWLTGPEDSSEGSVWVFRVGHEL